MVDKTADVWVVESSKEFENNDIAPKKNIEIFPAAAAAQKTLPLVHKISFKDLTAVAAIHASAFPDAALTLLGREAVRRYYEWQMSDAHDAVILGATVENKLAGFCFGGVYRGAASGFLRRNRFYLAWRIASRPWMLGNPVFRRRLSSGKRIRQLCRLLLKNTEKINNGVLKTQKTKPKPEIKFAETETTAPRSYGILSLGVDKLSQGTGIGYALMNESEAIARARGFVQMDLWVHTDNWQAIRFYERLGWTRILKENTWRGEMRKIL